MVRSLADRTFQLSPALPALGAPGLRLLDGHQVCRRGSVRLFNLSGRKKVPVEPPKLIFKCYGDVGIT